MCDVQTNGISANFLIAKPTENSTANVEPVTAASSSRLTSQTRPQRSCGPDRVRLTPRRHMPPQEKSNEEHLSNQKKQRYWNSWEEMYIVELWRRYRDEVNIINVPLPVYRKMMVAMRNRNMMVTAQDCRRKINTLNTRYKQELRHLQLTGCKSEWRLFPLIHCVLQPKVKDYDPWHEAKIIKKLLDKLPKPVEETPPPTPIITNNHHQMMYTHNVTNTSYNASSYQYRSSSSINHNYPVNNLLAAETLATNRLPTSTAGQFEGPSIFPFRNITMAKIEQIRQDNNRLAAQRDEDLKSLHLEEANFRCFETFIRIWTEQKEFELNRVKLLTQPNDLNIENEENHNMEQNIPETVAAK